MLEPLSTFPMQVCAVSAIVLGLAMFAYWHHASKPENRKQTGEDIEKITQEMAKIAKVITGEHDAASPKNNDG